MQADAISPGQTVVIVDDIIATGARLRSTLIQNRKLTQTLSCNTPLFAGGSAAAACELAEKQGGKVLQYLFVAEASFLGGSAKLAAPVYSIVKFPVPE